MAIQTVFSNNLDPATANLSSRFTNAVAFYIAAPLINAELEIDVFLQVYFPAIVGEQARNIPLGKIAEQSILLNVTDTETANIIPAEFLNTGLEMALLFLASETTFLQAAIVQPDCSNTEICQRLTAIEAVLGIVTNPVDPNLSDSNPEDFFYLQ